ncbi:efflux RND transporter periplasmic adaptor subunit [Rhodoferax sp.]|uniref:efflux RND transporter periplasmic adaptor subunit n=1 Tax=Rhodoferax sp. TaxID=50421 RepID=UPI0026395403|nr:efflux RND transporter periplasmic adaptor subunit [Rhodoferax sp.]MDD3936999.1 efflux RND transporter periplasmic adaptor subunit [Rhodoferax sp.]
MLHNRTPLARPRIPTPPSSHQRIRTSAALGLTLLLAACGQGSTPAAGPGASGGMPPPAEVGVITVKLADVGLVTELPGRLEASRVAQVRARAAGIVQKRLFVEGSQVRAGQALFQIDASPYQATLTSAQASVTKAEANLMQASAQAERFKPLIEAKAISQQEFVNAQAAQKLAEGDLAVARAAVQTARINLGYAAITAPISGRIGRALVTEGALVGQGEATPMAVIQQTDPMYINFTQSASEVMRLRKAMEAGQLKRAGSQAASVRLMLEDGSEYARPGKLLFSDLTVDSTSGQITLRAEVPNPTGTLLPGLFVRVRLEQAQVSSAITLPQQAVTRSAQGDSVMVVAADGKVAPRPVKVGAQQNGQWVILDGLQSGDQVMVDGFQKLRGDAPVKTVPWQAPGSAPAQAAHAASAPVPAASTAH